MKLPDKLIAMKLSKAGYDLGAYYAKALDEVREEKTAQNFWASAFADAKGNDERAKALYVKRRGLDLCKSACSEDVERERQLQEKQKITQSEIGKKSRPPWTCLVCEKSFAGDIEDCPHCGYTRP